MLNLIEDENIDKEYHWALRLVDYYNHPLQEIIKDFTPQSREFFLSSYLYLGELKRKNKNKKICIIHFYSFLNGPIKFMSMQNLESYKNMKELSNNDIQELSKEITRETVIDLSKSDSLNKWYLDKIYNVDYFFVTDETGFVKVYNNTCEE